jgi:hypothetical protein
MAMTEGGGGAQALAAIFPYPGGCYHTHDIHHHSQLSFGRQAVPQARQVFPAI